MIKALIVLLSFSVSFATDFSSEKWKQLFEQFQQNYRTFSIDDIKQLKSKIQSGDYQASSRDMEEFYGEWFREDETMELYVTVDSDQSVPNMLALSAMVEAEGVITATGTDFEEELTYLLDQTMMDDGDGSEYNWACDDEDGTDWYESEDECNMYCETDCYFDDGGDFVVFTKADSADWTLPENQDRITDNVWITRKHSQSLFNIAQEDGYSGNSGSPVGTLWADTITTAADSANYTSFVALHGGSPQSLIGDTVSLYLPQDGLYFDVTFLSYGGGNSGGGFSYIRTAVTTEDIVITRMIMNMSFFEFFMMLFGLPPEGVEDPFILSFEMDTNRVVNLVEGVMFSDNGEMLVLAADEEGLSAGAVFNEVENTITFNNLELEDSLRVTQVTVDGTIGPGTIDFEAGVPTLVPFLDPEMFGEEELEEDVYMVFNDDSTGMEIYHEEDDYYGEVYIDTSDFAWAANSEMVWLKYLDDGEWICNENPDDPLYWNDEDECNDYCNVDCYYEDLGDTLSLSYEFDEDTLQIGADVDVCDDYDSFEECIEEEEFPIPPDLRDITDFYVSYGRTMVFTGDNVSTAHDNVLIPNQFKVYDAYPNPFNPVTTLRYQLPEANLVSVIIYDMAGKEVKTLIHQQQNQGLHTFQWNGTNNLGNTVSAGIYLYQVHSGIYNQTNKMILLK